MHPDHGTHEPGHAAGGWWIPEAIGAVALLFALALYLAAVRRVRTRSPWPRHRTALWVGGSLCVGIAWVGPLPAAAHTDFTVHMAGHLLLGMVGPLLLVLAAPVTLALRALSTRRARGLARVLRSPLPRVVTHPVVAATLNAGGLWVLYATDLYAAMHQSVLVHTLVHLHVFLAGVAFTVSVISPDPNPHRAGLRTRVVVLVCFIAAHSVLGRWLCGHPPAGVDPDAARAGAQLMFYGGEAVDLVFLVLLFRGWYPQARRGGGPAARTPSGRPGEEIQPRGEPFGIPARRYTGHY